MEDKPPARVKCEECGLKKGHKIGCATGNRAASGRTIERLTREARTNINEARKKLADAAWAAGQQKDYELDKSLTATAETLHGVSLLLISLPRLKG